MSTSSVTSEALQLKLRQLLPSQQGFGTDLSASDTIIPIVDLTQAAEGSDVSETLQTAFSFGSQTSFDFLNSNGTIADVPGFYRIFGVSSVNGSGSAAVETEIAITDGSTSKAIFKNDLASGSTSEGHSVIFDFTVFITVGESVTASSSNSDANLTVTVRQVADSNGTLVQPAGFSPQ
jgi:hypothetical protein